MFWVILILMVIGLFIRNCIKEKKEREQQEIKRRQKHLKEIQQIKEEGQKRKYVTLPGFGFWIEDILEVNCLLDYVQQAVDIAKKEGYSVNGVWVSDGVHELDTGYESFSGATYSSFERAKKQLPIDFVNQMAELDGRVFFILNFETVRVEMMKNGISSYIRYSRGKLELPDDLYVIYKKRMGENG